MNKILKYIFSAAQVVLLSSCTSLFKPLDENVIDESFVQNHPANAEGLLLTAYDIFNDMHCWTNQNSLYYLSVASDDAVSNKNNAFRRMVTGELSSSNNPIGNTRWNESFKGVTYANKLLSMVDKVKWSEDNEAVDKLYRNRITGEALALRSALHMTALECFAGEGADGKMYGVPYFDKFLTESTEFNDYQRLLFDDCVEKLNADFEKAFELLPFVYSDNPADIPAKDSKFDPKDYMRVNGSKYNNRINGQIVRALQARLMLFAGSEAYTTSPEKSREYNEKAAGYANELLKSKNYALATDGLEFYNADDDLKNPEFVWRMSKLEPGATPENENFMPSLNGKGTVNPSQNFVDAFPMKNGYPITESESHYDEDTPYLDRDPRLGKFVIYHGCNYKGTTVNLSSDNALDGIGKVFDKSTLTGYYLKKLLRNDSQISENSIKPQMHIYPLVRYTEIFLILAEAQNNIGGPDFKISGSEKSAKDILRMIRKRAMNLVSDPYLDSISDEKAMMKLIQNERRIELSFEGFRFWDMRRWGLDLDETIMGYNPDAADKFFVVEERPMSDTKYRYMPLLRNDIRKFHYVQNMGW